jgi:hypothetical protein
MTTGAADHIATCVALKTVPVMLILHQLQPKLTCHDIRNKISPAGIAQVFEKRVLRRTSECNREQMTGKWRMLYCEVLRLPHCLDTRITDGSRAVSPKCQLLFTPEKFLVLVSEAVNPRP